MARTRGQTLCVGLAVRGEDELAHPGWAGAVQVVLIHLVIGVRALLPVVLGKVTYRARSGLSCHHATVFNGRVFAQEGVWCARRLSMASTTVCVCVCVCVCGIEGGREGGCVQPPTAEHACHPSILQEDP